MSSIDTEILQAIVREVDVVMVASIRLPDDTAYVPIAAALVALYRWQMRAVAIAEEWNKTLELDMPALNEVDEGIRTSRDAVTTALRKAGVAL